MNKQILKLAVPNIISNLSIPLLGMVDIAMLGRLDSEKYVGAISLGSVIFAFIYWMFSFLRMGTSGMTAQAYGQKDYKKTYRLIVRGALVAIIFSIILILIQDFIAFTSFNALSGSEEVEFLANRYFSIRIFAAPATLLLYVFSGWFIGMQNSKVPMYITIFVNLLNVILNYIFLFKYNMNVEGVALGTVISQYAGLSLAIFFFIYSYRNVIYKISLKCILLKSELVKFLTINKDFFIRTMCIIIAIASFTNLSAKQGDKLLAVNTILLQFFYFFSFFADGFAYAAEALTGRFVGERSVDKVKLLLKTIFVWGAVIAVLTSACFYFFGINILNLLTTDQNIIAIANKYLFWTVLIPVLSFASFIWDGIYIGATASKILMYTTLFALLFVYFPIIYFFFDNNNHYLWAAFLAFLFSRGLVQTIFYKRIFKFAS